MSRLANVGDSTDTCACYKYLGAGRIAVGDYEDIDGISHWQYARFDLYRVNPPLVRCIAALPVLLADPETDYTGWQNGSYSRSEFGVGRAFAIRGEHRTK